MPGRLQHRDALLRAPCPREHLVQFYRDDAVLVQSLARFVGRGLERGEAVIVIALAEHIAALTTRPLDEGAFVVVEAQDCLSRVMVDGMPDRRAFRSVVTPILDRVRDAGYERIRLFGEMVELLRPEQQAATVRLEELWNELIADYEVSLLCAYRLANAGARSNRGILHRITRVHSHAFELDDADPLGLRDDDELSGEGHPVRPRPRRRVARR